MKLKSYVREYTRAHHTHHQMHARKKKKKKLKMWFVFSIAGTYRLQMIVSLGDVMDDNRNVSKYNE